MDRNEKKKLRERALKARQASLNRILKKRERYQSEDDEGIETVRLREHPSSLDDWIVRLLRDEDVAKAITTDFPDGERALVISVGRKVCDVIMHGERLRCELTSEMAASQQSGLAVGDDVRVVDGQLRAILPRRTKLARPDPGSKASERVIVANVDLVVVVVSVKSPPLHPRILDRYLIAIGKGGAKAAICVNKADLAPDDDPDYQLLKPYAALAPIVRSSATQHQGLNELRELLHGKLSAFVGHSGVGKSSLMNALKPDLNLVTGEVSASYGRGTHTTTSSHLWDLGDETRIIDTPGVRSFGLFDLTKSELAYYFPEFSGFYCRFRDCTHTVEPGCGIEGAVSDGLILRERWDTYRRIYAGLTK